MDTIALDSAYHRSLNSVPKIRDSGTYVTNALPVRFLSKGTNKIANMIGYFSNNPREQNDSTYCII